MNSFRIGVTGLLTETYGTSHTEGFLHFFEGWVVFVASLIILIGIAILLTNLLPSSPKLTQVFSLNHLFTPNIRTEKNQSWQTSYSVIIMLISLIIAVAVSSPLAERSDNTVESKPFSMFPKMLGKWKANEKRLPASIVAVAGASDYYNGNFTSPKGIKIIGAFDDLLCIPITAGMSGLLPAVCPVPAIGFL